jgi:hypothetical protein
MSLQQSLRLPKCSEPRGRKKWVVAQQNSIPNGMPGPIRQMRRAKEEEAELSQLQIPVEEAETPSPVRRPTASNVTVLIDWSTVDPLRSCRTRTGYFIGFGIGNAFPTNIF